MLRYILVGEIEDIVINPMDPIKTALAPRPDMETVHVGSMPFSWLVIDPQSLP